ncbi:hypothetical protein PHMEG_00015202 [Phytophthora megakarya]|uniref:Eukaryotic/viral aspartic protease n=1 Tax=Phytophthora megakarya TaxID=4795 RepID=A0A225W2X5_9STRA|nr:hypothetical protein PHMEG_00015202 [Phytophthora megakarya]
MLDGGVLQPDPPMVRSDQAHGYAARSCRKDVKLGCSSGWNPIRAERSRYCIYAIVRKTSVDRVSKQRDVPDNTRDLHRNHTFAISSLRQADEYARSDVANTVDLHPGESRDYWKQKDPDLWYKPADQETTAEITKPSRIAEYRGSGCTSTSTLDLLPGESRGYWKHLAPGKWFRQAKIIRKIHNEKVILLLYTGADVSIVDTSFARKVGCYIDSSQIQDCVGLAIMYIKRKEERSLVYFFDIWVGDRSGQEAILGMDFMVPAMIGLDLSHGSNSLLEEVRIQLTGRRQLYSDKARIVNLGQYLRVQPRGSAELLLPLRTWDHEKFWITRGDRWVPTIAHGPGRIRYMRITNVGDKVLILHQDLQIGLWLAGDHVPRLPGFISVGSRRYMRPWIPDLQTWILMRKISQGLRWSAPNMKLGVEYWNDQGRRRSSGDQEVSDHPTLDNPPADNPPLDCRPLDVASVASDVSDLLSIADDDSMSHVVTAVKALDDQDPDYQVEDPAVETVLTDEAPSGVTGADPPGQEVQNPKVATLKGDGLHTSSLMGVESGTSHKLGDPLDHNDSTSMSQKRDEDPAAVLGDQPNTSDLDLTWASDQDYDECVYYHEDSDLYAEDVDGQLAVLPQVPATTEDVEIDDIQLCGSDNQTPEEIDRLRQRIWKFRHLLIGKGNALPLAARWVVSLADRTQMPKATDPVPREIGRVDQGSPVAKMINHSRSPWTSPIVVIIKKNGVDIRLRIDYRLVSSLTQLMV